MKIMIFLSDLKEAKASKQRKFVKDKIKERKFSQWVQKKIDEEIKIIESAKWESTN